MDARCRIGGATPLSKDMPGMSSQLGREPFSFDPALGEGGRKLQTQTLDPPSIFLTLFRALSFLEKFCTGEI